jgi:2-polyprenyl-3-methyl-5-hydroxy-6-metoxy-1,4-benzoquinol methylase
MNRDDWDERYRAKDFPWGAEPTGFLVEAVAQLAPGRALDLACGQGRNAVWLAGEGWEVAAVDWSEVGLAQGRALAAEAGVTVEWRAADLRSWVPPQGAFDLVMVVYLQIPVRERRAVWRNAAAAVAPGGRLVIIGHDSANLTEGYGGPQDPGVLFTAEEVSQAVGDLVEVIRAEQVYRMVETDETTERAVDNIVIGAAV